MRIACSSEKEKAIKIILKKMIDDDEVWAGGIFQKEEYYLRKYPFISQEEMGRMEYAIFCALRNYKIAKVED